MGFPKDLKGRLRSGKVIPFVGAGVSRAVISQRTGKPLFPSWVELLRNAADRLDEEAKPSDAELVRSLLEKDPPELLEAAAKARSGLGAGGWFRFLREEFDHDREEVDDESLSLAKLVWELGSPLLITTNYDRVLHWSCPSTDNLQTWDIQAAAEQSAALRDRIVHPTIWHLHGHIGNAASLILTPDGYSRLYPKACDVEVQYRAALETLRRFMTSHTLLFVGFSLDDDRFGMELRGVDEIFKGATGPHYVLVREADEESVRADDLPVEFVTFKEFGSPLIELLSQLTKIASEESPRTMIQDSEADAIISSAHVASYDPRNTVFYVPYRPKGDQVIGREETIQAVHDQLTTGHRTAIGQTAAFDGLGGLGKTQLAVEYAYRYQNEYPNGVVWLSADQEIDAQLTDLAEKAHWIAPQSEHQFKLDIAQQRLRTYSECLIVFDNVESLEAIEKYLPEPQANPHLLLTSRTEQPGFTPVPLDVLSIELSIELLLMEAGRSPTKDAEWAAIEEVAKALDGLPLALELAGAYVRYREIDWADYRDLLKHSFRAALPGKFLQGSFTKHEKDIYSTLKINEEVFVDEPGLREILDLLTWSGSAPMGVSLMCALLHAEKAAELTSALSLGTALRLLRKSPESDRYAIHQLVREVRREEIPLRDREDWITEVCTELGNWFQDRRNYFEELSIYEAEIDHLREWQQHAAQYRRGQSSRLIWLQAYPPYYRGQYQASKQYAAEALELLEETSADELLLKAHILNSLGSICRELADYGKAIDHLQKGLTIRLEVLGEKHGDTATSFSDLGWTYAELGDYQQALECAERALRIRHELFGQTHRATFGSLAGLGILYWELDEPDRALKCETECLEFALKFLGELHPDTAAAYNNLAGTYYKLGDYERAIDYERKSLAIRLQLFGEHHPATATSYINIGTHYGDRGEHELALKYKERALTIFLELFGEHHTRTAVAFNNLGFTYRDQGDYETALHYELRGLEIFLAVVGEQHPSTATAFDNVGTVYALRYEYELALEASSKALKLRRQLLGDVHSATLSSLSNVAELLSILNRPGEAFQLVDDALRKLHKDHQGYSLLQRRRQQLLAKPLRKGFSQPPANPRKKRKPKAKKRR